MMLILSLQGSAVLGNLESIYSCGCSLTCSAHPPTIAERNDTPSRQWLPLQDNAPCPNHGGPTVDSNFLDYLTIPDQFWQCSRAHRPDIRTCHCHDRLYFVDFTLSKICIQRWEMVLSPFLWKLLSRCSWSLPAGAGSQGGIVRVRCWHLARPLPRLLMPAWSIYPSISIFISIYSIYVMPMRAEWRLIMCHCCTMHVLCKWSEEDFLHHSIFRGSVCLRDEMKPNLEYLLSAS